MKTKNIFSKLAVFTLFATFAFLSACNVTPSPNLTLSSTITSSTEATIEWLIDNAYDNGDKLGEKHDGVERSGETKEPYTYSEVVELITANGEMTEADAPDYYVEVGTMKDISTVSSITLGGVTYEDGSANETFRLSIGNSNFIVEKAFKTNGNKLYIAAPILAFESTNSNQIKINNSTFDFNVENPVENLEIESVGFHMLKGQTQTPNSYEEAAPSDDFDYLLTFNNSVEVFCLFYEDAAAEDVILTRKVSNGNLQSFGLTGPDKIGDDYYCLAYYPIGHNENFVEVDKESLEGNILDYKLFVQNKGTATVRMKITFENSPND